MEDDRAAMLGSKLQNCFSLGNLTVVPWMRFDLNLISPPLEKVFLGFVAMESAPSNPCSLAVVGSLISAYPS